MSREIEEAWHAAGRPGFLDPNRHDLVNAAGANANRVWHPANAAARKLWACSEAARDIHDLLADETGTIESRRLKLMVTSLESFRVAAVQLGDYLRTSPDVKDRIVSADRSKLEQITTTLKTSDEFREPANLKLIRDKLGAHLDRDTESWSAQEILAPLTLQQMVGAIHLCISAVLTFLEFNVYAWTASDCPDGHVRLLAAEPSLVTLRIENGQPVAIAGIEFVRSPRYAVSDLCQLLASKAQRILQMDDGSHTT